MLFDLQICILYISVNQSKHQMPQCELFKQRRENQVKYQGSWEWNETVRDDNNNEQEQKEP